MIYFIIIIFLMSCRQGDIGLINMSENKQGDTSNSQNVDENSDVVQDTQAPEPDIAQPNEVDYSKIIGLAEYHFRQVACPACVGETQEFDTSAYLKLHYPTSGNYFDHLNYLNNCTTQIYGTHVSTQPVNYTGNALFTGDTQTIQLNPTGQGEWSASNIMEYQYERQTFHDVTIQNTTLSAAFQTVEGFDWIEPYTLLWVDPSYAFDAAVYRSGTTFTWSPVVANSNFEVIIAVYSWDGSQFLGAVSCLSPDSGSLTIPSQYLQSYPQGSLAAVHLIRHRMHSVEAPELDGTLQTHMMWEVVGTAHIE